jgi:hypothetical protein
MWAATLLVWATLLSMATFTTTGTDSLAVTDPFIFLAANNPGDTFDSGVVSQFYDGANTRYTGYFRDITDAKYKLFTNLLTAPTTTVDTTDPSFQLTDLVLANVSATGNVNATYFVGNGAALTGISSSSSNIFLGNTSVAIACSLTPMSTCRDQQCANCQCMVRWYQCSWRSGRQHHNQCHWQHHWWQCAHWWIGIGHRQYHISSQCGCGQCAHRGAESVLAGNVTGGNVNATTAVSAGGNVVGGNFALLD